ncbi:Aste57867_21075 [Aphanomyces stellatus]|uniref:Aste57867_21075 protein n=1 Tax=Aphanomyces stellatus TaxID=120398 RepID=A0A485LGK4_9STRA|nr:hypothetical protein As57867_021007 [Aphanomyces stellatus]VFT97749.1 Aste57867_21075 [Aphanomyces stellatus]
MPPSPSEGAVARKDHEMGVARLDRARGTAVLGVPLREERVDLAHAGQAAFVVEETNGHGANVPSELLNAAEEVVGRKQPPLGRAFVGGKKCEFEGRLTSRGHTINCR